MFYSFIRYVQLRFIIFARIYFHLWFICFLSVLVCVSALSFYFRRRRRLPDRFNVREVHSIRRPVWFQILLRCGSIVKNRNWRKFYLFSCGNLELITWRTYRSWNCCTLGAAWCKYLKVDFCYLTQFVMLASYSCFTLTHFFIYFHPFSLQFSSRWTDSKSVRITFSNTYCSAADSAECCLLLHISILSSVD